MRITTGREFRQRGRVHGHVRWLIGMGIVATWGVASIGLAQEPSAPEPETPQFASPLARLVYAQRDGYRDITESQLAGARQRVGHAFRRLDQFLTRTTAENRQNWERYLRWEGLHEELTSEGNPRLVPLDASYQRLASGEPGLELAPFADLREELRELLEQLRMFESRSERVPAEWAHVASVAAELEAYLQSGGEQKESGWKRFLRWDDLQRELGGQAPEPRVIREVRRQLDGDQPGLERTPFRRLARALSKFEEVRKLAGRSQAPELFRARMTQLANSIEAYRHTASNDDAATILSVVRWLQQTRQQPAVVQQVRHAFSRPNLHVAFSGRWVERELQDRVFQRSPVRRCFEGSYVRGTAATCSDVGGRLVPSDHSAVIEISVDGRTVSDNIAQKRRVYVSTQSHIGMLGRKQLIITESGLSSLPACGTASTLQYYRGACVDRRVGRRLITRGARRKASESRLRAQCVASSDAVQQLVRRMEQQSNEMVMQANQRLDSLRRQLKEERLYPEALRIWSTTEHLRMQAVSRDAKSLAATSLPPAVLATSDVNMQLHQSAINNVLAQRLGGIKIDDQSVVRLLEQYDVDVPEELRKPSAKLGEGAGADEEYESWSLTFDRDLPASVTFEDGLVRIGIRGRSFSREEQQVNERIEIAAGYRLLRTVDGHIVAERVGDLDVRFVNERGQLSPRQLSYKVFLERKFSALFRDRITSYEFIDREGWERLRDVMLDQIQAGEGWLTACLSVRPGIKLSKS